MIRFWPSLGTRKWPVEVEIRCPHCNANITDYQRADGQFYCPWCDATKEGEVH